LLDAAIFGPKVNVAGGWAGGNVAATDTLNNFEEQWRMNTLSSLAAAHVGATRVNKGAHLPPPSLFLPSPWPRGMVYGVAGPCRGG